ncbi:MAG: substrate-binding domain-containing protein [Ktedonobacteraceae bacterium]|nr:substrate-binding domain-containing protein [Ktedonobacteraceae bacterium]
MLDLGHQHVAIIVDEQQQALRLEGFASTMQEAGIALLHEKIQSGASTLESGYSATKNLLAHPQRPTAIFAATDWMAMGALEAALDAGLRVPEDLSVIGLDDIMLSAHLHPPLTTIAVPKAQLAQETMDLLLKQIDGDKDVPALRLVEPYLVSRQSTTTNTTA